MSCLRPARFCRSNGEIPPNTMVDDERGGRPCPMCDARMYERHCKYVCPNHGVVYDCADTFY